MLNANDTAENIQTSAKRNIKDCVFTNMFGDKKYLIQMYKALHPEVRADHRKLIYQKNFLRVSSWILL